VRASYCAGIASLFLLLASNALQNAVAEGDTRTISMHHIHTNEDITITYKRNGRYDEDALKKLNWFLRDWRKEEETKMDPHLIDLVWEVHREINAKEPIWVVCGYRSPQTNAMLRRRSGGVAKFSQHMLGHAMDFYIPGVGLEDLRVIGLRLQRGGVGYYPTSGSPFVHLDTGSIRHWPRMTHDQLVRVFPNGRTVHIPSDGHPLPGYAVALAEVNKRGSNASVASLDAARQAGVSVASADRTSLNPFAKLFGLHAKSDDEEEADAAASDTAANTTVAKNTTVVSAADRVAPAPRTKAAKPTVVAALDRSTERAAEKTAEKSAEKSAEKAAEKRVEKKATAAAASTAPAPMRIAAIPVVAPSRPAQAASLVPRSSSANDVISARGYWQGLPDGMIAAVPASDETAAVVGASRRRIETASADPDATGALSPWASAAEDRVPPELALAYAAQPGSDPAPRATSPIGSQTMVRSNAQSDTTIVYKRNHLRPTISRVQRHTTIIAPIGSRIDNPWMRAVLMSPSVHEYLTITLLGPHDFMGLEPLMLKPENSVMMTFSGDPHLGLDHDRFSGSAVVFVSTVTYTTHTAALQ
jgi:uncharacterized protein YcbK (DUF882 family)